MQKNKSWLTKVGIGFAILFCLLAIARFTNTLQYYTTRASGNSPTIKMGDIIWASRFKTLQRGNFIVFKTYDSLTGYFETWVKRCVGMPGDTLEMKDGILFVNRENVDVAYTLNNEYLIRTDDPDKFRNALLLPKDESVLDAPKPTLTVTISTQQYKRIQLLILKGHDYIDQVIYPNDASFQLPFFIQLGKTSWTLDNFGPLTVPSNNYFVMGDNRHGSQDSRYIGFIKKEDYVGTVLGK